MTSEEFDYWSEQKKAYEKSLKNNVGNRVSIEQLLEKISEKLTRGIGNLHK